MPIYEMRCKCGHTEDIFRSIANIDVDLPFHCGVRMFRGVCAPSVVPDTAAYQAVAVDKKTGRMPVIEGRVQHREFLKRNGYVEIGNDLPKKREIDGDFNVRKELTEATKQVLAKQRA
jgi:hypothetical protein